MVLGFVGNCTIGFIVFGWQQQHGRSFVLECGFDRGLACAVVFYNAEKDIACVVHGDDFPFCGAGPELLWITEKM